jgi:hypothetical protein
MGRAHCGDEPRPAPGAVARGEYDGYLLYEDEMPIGRCCGGKFDLVPWLSGRAAGRIPSRRCRLALHQASQELRSRDRCTSTVVHEIELKGVAVNGDAKTAGPSGSRESPAMLVA